MKNSLAALVSLSKMGITVIEKEVRAASQPAKGFLCSPGSRKSPAKPFKSKDIKLFVGASAPAKAR
jgi:hypothetical protein